MEQNSFIEKYENILNKVIMLHDKIKDINISLKELHPVAIVKDNDFYVFDVDEQEKRYRFTLMKESPLQHPIPEDVMAAFQLEFYDDRFVAIMGDSTLDNPDNYAFLFHEFVHCYVGSKFESNIKKNLKIDKQEREANNMIWEITYTFPYEDDNFVCLTQKLNDVTSNGEYIDIVSYHNNMKNNLSEIDFEYMIWTEWKEGFARYIENLICERLGMKMNENQLCPPFSRVTFYEIGSRYIKFLLNDDKTLCNDLDKLFYKMMSA